MKFKVGDKAIKTRGYEFPCTIVSVFETVNGDVRIVGEMDGYGLLHIFNETQLELSSYSSQLIKLKLVKPQTQEIKLKIQKLQQKLKNN